MLQATSRSAVRTGSSRQHVAAKAQAVAAPVSTMQKTMTLVDTPVSNNGARVRFVMYKKGLEDQVQIVPTNHFGGSLKSPEFLKLNPQGKFPLLVLPDGSPLPESEVIVQYLLDAFADVGPQLRPSGAKEHAIASLITRIHDLYIVPVQGCLYRPYDSAELRASHVAQLAYQLDVIENTMLGPYLAGAQISSADGALFPTMVFYLRILPKYFGWQDVFAGRPKLRQWWDLISQDSQAAKIIGEIEGGLAKWEEAERWKVNGISNQIANNPQLKWAF